MKEEKSKRMNRRKALVTLGAAGLGLIGASWIKNREIPTAEAAENISAATQAGNSANSVYNVKTYGAFGDGLNNDAAAINQAVQAAVGSGGGTIYFPTGTYRIRSGLTFPESVDLEFVNGARLLVDSGFNLYVYGGVKAGIYQIFEGGGRIFGEFNVPQVYPEWWGAKAGNNDSTAISSALEVLDPKGGRIVFSKGTYQITGTVTFQGKNNIVLEGFGSVLSFQNVSLGLEIIGCTNFKMQGMELNGNYNSNNLVRFSGCDQVFIEDVKVKNCRRDENVAIVPLVFVGTTNVLLEKCHVENIDSKVSKISRGVYFSSVLGGKTSRYITIRRCKFQNITPIDDGDAIHFLQQDNENGVVDGTVDAFIQDCHFIDCAKRGVKAQASGVTVQDCKFYDLNFQYEHYTAIALHCSNSSAIRNTVRYNTCLIGIGANNHESLPQKNIQIEENIIEITRTGNVNQYGILFGSALSRWRCDNVRIRNNKLLGDKLFSAIQFTYGNDVTVEGNVAQSMACVVGQQDSNFKVTNASITGNLMKSLQLGVQQSIVTQNAVKGGGNGFDLLAVCTNLELANNYIDTCKVGVNVRAGTNSVQITANRFVGNLEWDLRIDGDSHKLQRNEGLQKIYSVSGKQYQFDIRLSEGDTAPVSGFWSTGDIFNNTAPTRLRNIGFWKCVSGGSGGVWMAFGCGYGTKNERDSIKLTRNDAGYQFKLNDGSGSLFIWDGTKWV
ncbi:glycosyl hydrolase family 28-related protein [Paenibacillus hodogayensis]|uniref:Glycosyl hydrolase family 28-related protein n=1 Tax=Paenibacillus hodogayensis TaxID=279208 RepID=A0ABV5W8E7_9BACL